jgi:mono/diheme cytochrome c family protein
VLLVSGDAPAKLSRDDAQKLKSPVANTKKSIDRGRAVFLQNCTSCHGENGKAEGSLIADATDLSTPSLYKSGSSEARFSTASATGQAIRCPRLKRSSQTRLTFGI